MNILELDSFNLADAVKFNDELNPRMWDGNKMRPEVREKLLAIAADFQESLGVSGLDVEDITVSGSNAGYTYTPHSDIDLHLVVRMPEECDDVYQELFNAKKYQYNDEHDIRIGGYDVELYVQPADQPHVSAGVYSVAKDDWIHIPRKIAARVDDESVRNKYEDIKARIESALKSSDTDRLRKLWDKIKEMRRSGLAQNGELGAENLAFKMLRTQGDLGRLKDAIAHAKDAELSLTERKKKKKKSRVKYGFGGYWYPGFAFGSGEGSEGGGGDGGGESVREVALTPDGVSASTKMFLSEKDVPSHTEIIFDFMRFAVKELELDNEPVLKIKKDPQWSAVHKSFGRYRNDLGQIELAVGNRHIMDVLRTLAHELQHRKQDEREHMPSDAGETGSPYENEAHVVAGILMRKYADMHPEYFEDVPMAESASGYIPKNKKEAQDPRYAMAVTQDIKPGQTGKEANKMALKTDAQGRPALLMKTVNLREGRAYDGNEPMGPETPPTMPAGTVRIDVSDMYDWYKLGQHISNMKGLGRHDFGAGPPSSIISFGDEETEHKFIKDLEATGLDVTDIDPRDPAQPAGMRRIKTDPTYNVDESPVYENTGTEPVIFLNPNTAIVGQSHGKPLALQPQTLKRIQDIAAKHGAWYEGNGADRVYTKGQIDQYQGSWDDLVAKTASPNDPKWLYVLFSNVDENNRVQRVGINPNDTIFNRLLATAKDNSFQAIGFTAQALQKFLSMASEGNVDFVQMSQQPATQQNLTRFLKAGEALMWPANWSQYPHRAGKIAKAATVDVRDQFLASRKTGVYVVGSGHLLAVKNLTSMNEGRVHNIAPDQLIDVVYNPSRIDKTVEPVKVATIPYQNLERLAALLKQKHGIQDTDLRWSVAKPTGTQQLEEQSDQQYLWHGSRQKIPMLEPRQARDTGGAAGSNKNAIYATPDPKIAIAMGLTTPGSDTGMFPNDPQMVLFSGKIRKGENVYLHKLPFNGPDGKPQFVQGGNSREFYSVPGVKGIEPIEIKAVPVDQYLHLIRPATPQDLELRKKYTRQGVAENDLVESLRREFAMLEDELLGEIKMTSSNLSQLAAKIPGALVGLEFEMIVPGTRRSNFKDVALDFMNTMGMDSVAVGEYHGSGGYEQWDGGGWTDVRQDDDRGAYEQDWDADESVYDIDSILSFFSDGGYNSRRDISNLRDELQAEFEEYWTSQLDVLWEEQGFEYFKDYIENNDLFDRDEALITARDEIIEANPDLDTDSEEFQSLLSNRVNELEDEFVQESWEEGSRGYSSDYDQARSEFNDEMMQTITEDDWLTAAGYRHMSDIVARFDITWPYWIDGEDDRPDPEKPSNVFTIETDGSLDPDDPSSELGLEFVSPPIPLKDVGRVMQQVQWWAASVGAYTGKANKTSMHANISVPGYDLQNLDYLKAAILLGDEYVLREFGRIGNTYAEPAIEKIKQLVRQQPDKVKQLLDRMKTDLNAQASKLIHSGETGKYTSINTKDNRIEYRSPGGDYLSDIADNPQKITDVINRMVVTMDAALDPNKYKQEYQKKLYKVLTGQTFGREAETGAKQPTKADDKDLLNIFSRYAAGELPKQALKSFVRQAQLQRSVAKGKQTGPMWWNVEWDNNRRIEVVANNEKEAVAVAAREWGINPQSAAGQSLRATPLKPYQEPAQPRTGPTVFGRPSNPDGDFVIVSSTSRRPVYRFMAAGNDDADTVLLQWSRENTGDWLLRYDPDNSLGQPPVPGSTVDLQRQRAAAAATTTPAANQLWSLRLANGDEVHRFWNRNDRNEAGRYAANWLRNNGMGVSGEGFSIEPVSNNAQQQAQGADPGSLIDQGLAASGNFTGNWLIQDPDGNTIHRFGGIGNSQGDANNFAMRWLRQHPQFMQSGVTVSPEMA